MNFRIKYKILFCLFVFLRLFRKGEAMIDHGWNPKTVTSVIEAKRVMIAYLNYD